jgi:3-hydroxyisobutyrate dehydrogenase-like beta-hydroxyacid dehydrogenase
MNIDTEMFTEVVNECGGIGGSRFFAKFAADMTMRRENGEGRLRIAAKDMQSAADLVDRTKSNAGLLLYTAAQFKKAYDEGMGEE